MKLSRLKEIYVLDAEITLLEERRAAVFAKASSTVGGSWEVERTKAEDGEEECGSFLRSMPRGSGKSDKVAEGAVELCEIDKRLARAKQRRARLIGYIRKIGDDYVQSALLLKFEKKYSWDRIALAEGGGATGDCVRKRCERYLSGKAR